MSAQNKKKVIALFFIGFIVCVITTVALYCNIFSSYENRSWDWRAITVAASRKKDPHIRLITIDQRSLDYYAKEEAITWPWPRALYVPVIEFLKKAGARAVAFDLLFTESSVHGVGDDKAFAKSMNGSMPVINAAVISNDTLTTPVSEINSASLIGLVNAVPDADGIFRHTRPSIVVSGHSYLTLPFAVANSIGAKFTDNESVIANFRGPSHEYPEDNIVSIISSYVALTEGSTPSITLDGYKDALVFVGVSAPGLMDLRPTSVDKIFRGVEFNATVLDNILSNDFIKVVPLWWSILLTLIFVLLLSYALLFSQRAVTQSIISICGITLYIALAFFFALHGFWIAVAVPTLILILTIISSLGVQYQLEGRERRFIHQAFNHYVSPKVIDRILANPAQLSLGGERRELTIYFSDIRGFTSLSEKMPPEQLVSFLNKYLTEMTDIILASGGTLDKYEGDAIIAFWNAPLSVSDHAFQGVNAALVCQRRLRELRDSYREEFGTDVHVRIGVNTGVVTVGNFGSANRFDYTIIGDAANLASRLEGVNKVFGTSILISEESYLQCQEQILARYIGKVQVIGRGKAVAVYEPYEESQKWDSKKEEIFTEAMNLFEKGDLKGAATYFSLLPENPTAQNYLERIQKEVTSFNHSTWNSVWVLDSK